MPEITIADQSGFEIMLNDGRPVYVQTKVDEETARIVFQIPEGVTVIMGGRTPIPDTDLSEISVELRTQDKKRIM